jgi:cell division protein FtsB
MTPRFARKPASSVSRLRTATIVLLALLILIGTHYVRLVSRNKGISDEIAQLEQKIADLEQHNTQSIDLLDYLNSNAYLEEKARKDLGLKKPGEQAIVIQDIADQSLALESNGSVSEIKMSTNYQRWFTYFFNN